MDGELEKILGYKFKDESILKMAFTHSSCGLTGDDGKPYNNERLEFLGDAVLKLVFAEHLYYMFPDEDEGFLSKLASQLISGKTLFEESIDRGINRYLTLGKGEETTGGRTKQRNLAGNMEAIIGAIYIDGGMTCAKEFILRTLEHRIEPMLTGPVEDSKTQFQELIQKDALGHISYRVTEQSGPAHHPTFEVEVLVDQNVYGRGVGDSKRQAEQAAANDAIENMKKNDKNL